MRERKKGGKGSIRRKKRNKEKRGKRRDEIFPKISMHERKGNESNSKPQSSPMIIYQDITVTLRA